MFRCSRTGAMLRRIACQPRGKQDRNERVAAFHEALIDWGWRTDLGYGRVVCRDQQGRRTVLLVLPASGGAVLVGSRPGPLYLDGLTAGALRGALQTAVLSADPSVPANEHHALKHSAAWVKAAA